MDVLEVIAEALYVSFLRRHGMTEGQPEWADITDDAVRESWREDAIDALGYDPRLQP